MITGGGSVSYDNEPVPYQDPSDLSRFALQGIGAATVFRLAQEGAKIAIFDLPRQKEGAHALMKRVRDEIPGAAEVIYLEMDVRNEEQWASCMKTVEERWGPIDAMINNAGLDASAREEVLEEITLAKFNRWAWS